MIGTRATPATLAVALLIVAAGAAVPASAAVPDPPTAGSAPGIATQGTAKQGAAPRVPARGALAWSPCYGGDAQCARLSVPRDHADPDGPTISLAVLRLPASGGGSRGPLVVNPGGPGVPGRDYPLAVASWLPDVARDYDLVGFDPRGVGMSAPLRCQTDREMRGWFRADGTPDTRAERDALARLAARIGAGCERGSAALLPHLGTRDVARDLEALRIALDAPRLSFLGFSYGTLLGATYADMYPRRTGRVVLDGAVDPRLDQVGITAGQIDGFDHAVRRMAASCAESRRCPLGRSAGDVLQRINRLLRDLDSTPVPTGSGPPLTQTEAVTGILGALYNPARWPTALDDIAAALDGDGAALAARGRAFLSGDARFVSTFYAISCADSPATPGPDALAAWAERTARDSAVPELSRYLAWSVLPCHAWPAHRADPLTRLTAQGAGPILVIGTTHDPATPMPWTRALARQLDSAGLLEFRSDGHVALGRGNTCVDGVVTAYFARGAMPRAGAVCLDRHAR
ncbi:MAG: alpha/beta hydrolase [bacterium]